MASIINAATSGGLISTADTSGILQLQTAGTTAVTVDASQNVTVVGSLTAAGLSGPHNGTVGATTPSTGAFTSVRATSLVSTGTSQTAGANQLALVQSGATSILVAYGAGVGSGNRGAYDFYQADSAAGNIQIPFSISSAGAVSALTTFAAGTTIGVGGATPSTSGAGITFPADQTILGASTNANTLDDYEEGTWTPSIGGTATYSNQVGRYIKIGNQVFAHFAIGITTQGTGSTISQISGLPFASGIASQNCSNLTWSGFGVAMAYGVYYVGSGGTTLSLSYSTGAQTGLTNNPNSLVNGAQVQGSIVYTV